MEGRTFYETLSANPEYLDTFNKSMSEPGPDYGIFPFSSLKEEVKAEPERAFVIDIGGGKGQALLHNQLLHIQKESEQSFGIRAKLILQERPEKSSISGCLTVETFYRAIREVRVRKDPLS